MFDQIMRDNKSVSLTIQFGFQSKTFSKAGKS